MKKFGEYLMDLISQSAQHPDVAVSMEVNNNFALDARDGTDMVAVIIK